MARRRNRAPVSYAPQSRRRRYYGRIKSSGRKYSQRKNWALKKYSKKLAYGTLAGLGVSVPLTLAASMLGRPELVEVANRGGAITASMGGGPVGVVGYQVADALLDRFLHVPALGGNITGGNQVYL